jgi:membrane-bound metal-dependent hydrolase YbcI (DUF457 family)
MPLTPFHIGPALLIGLLLLKWLDLPTFLIANVIVDIEPVMVIAFGLKCPLHGFFHSFIGGTIAAFLLTIFMRTVRPCLSSLLSRFKIDQSFSLKSILSASLLGVYIHIILDSRMHHDIRPFYPFDFNPFLDPGVLSELWLETVLGWCFIGAVFVYLLRLFQLYRRNKDGLGL